MTARLEISPDLSLPIDAQTHTLVVYGGKGMGKTNLGSVLVEELAKRELRFSVIDPLDVWWGLQHGATRAGQGLDVVILGGPHGDIPIEPTAGAVVADFVVDEEVSTVVVLRGADGTMWTNGERIRFVTDYATQLFKRQGERRRPLMQVIDEAGRFVPQMAGKGDLEIAKCIGAIEQLVEWGRNIGVGVCLITQRSARMAKNVSELADAMIAFRTVGPNSIAAIVDWFGEHVPKERHRELVEQLRKLERGTALVVSPGYLEFESTARIRARETFDSSATPQHGKDLRAPGKARKPDLEQYRARMATTIEQAEAKDPRALRSRLNNALHEAEQLRRQLEAEKVRTWAGAKPGRPQRVRVVDAKLTERIQKAIAQHETTAELLLASHDKRTQLVVEEARKVEAGLLEKLTDLRHGLDALSSIVARRIPVDLPPADAGAPVGSGRAPVVPRAAVPAVATHHSPHRELTTRRAADGLPPMQRAFLTALAQRGKPLRKGQLLTLTTYRSSGPASRAFAELVAKTWASAPRPGELLITSLGLDVLGDYTPLPWGEELREHLLRTSAPMVTAFLKVLFDAYPEPVQKGEILKAADYQASGPASAAFARLVSAGYAEKVGAGQLKAADELFEADQRPTHAPYPRMSSSSVSRTP